VKHHDGADEPMILVLHEQAMLRSMFSCLVEWMGYHVEEACEIESARAVFKSGAHVVAVVSGCNFPDGTARDFMRQLRSQGIQTPFLVVSGSGTERIMEEHGFEFLPMPLRKEVFDRMIRRMISGQDGKIPSRRQEMPRSCRRALGISMKLVAE